MLAVRARDRSDQRYIDVRLAGGVRRRRRRRRRRRGRQLPDARQPRPGRRRRRRARRRLRRVRRDARPGERAGRRPHDPHGDDHEPQHHAAARLGAARRRPPGLAVPGRRGGARAGSGSRPAPRTTATFAVDAGCAAAGGDWSATARTGPTPAARWCCCPAPRSAPPWTGGCSLRFATAAGRRARRRGDQRHAVRPGRPAGRGRGARRAAARRPRAPPDRCAWRSRRAPPGRACSAGRPSAPAVGGRAEFADLTIDAAGGYRLTATAGRGGLGHVGRVRDRAGGDRVHRHDAATPPSPARSRRSTPPRPRTGGPGFLTLSLNVGPEPDCAGYREFSPDWVLVNGSANLTEKLRHVQDQLPHAVRRLAEQRALARAGLLQRAVPVRRPRRAAGAVVVRRRRRRGRRRTGGRACCPSAGVLLADPAAAVRARSGGCSATASRWSRGCRAARSTRRCAARSCAPAGA